MRVKQWFAKKILYILGWEVTGDPVNTPKALFVVAPHTHWLDIPLGFLIRAYLGLDVRFIAKKSLFTGMKGYIFRWLGGYPVDRSRNQGLVKSVVEAFNSQEHFYLGLAPEGTRKKVNQLRTGFYYIALEGRIPMFLTTFDFEHKRVEFTGPVWADGSNPDQIREIESHFRGIKGRVPEYSF